MSINYGPSSGVAVQATADLVATGVKGCSRCALVKPVGEFVARRDRPGKYDSLCRACRHTPEANARRAESAQRARLAAIEVYGGRCERCGLDDPRFLEFDHVDDDGKAHRKIESVATWAARVAREQRRDERWRLALLCTPCHRGALAARHHESAVRRPPI
jgi:hypothetical protein